MEVIYTIASIMLIAFLTCEVIAGVILYRNRHRVIPALRSLLGTDRLDLLDRKLTFELGVLNRKINYIGNHTKFEREELRRRGILRDEHQNLRIR